MSGMKKWVVGIVVVLAIALGFAASTQIDLLTQVKASCSTGIVVYIVSQSGGNGTGCDGLLSDSGTTLTYAGSGGISLTGSGTGQIQQTPGILSSLGTCNSSTKGTTAPITDSTTQVWGATVSGSSSNYAVVHCDGSNWTVMGK